MTMTADDLASRLVQGAVAFTELAAVAIGDRLGYYRWLAEHGALTAGELASGTRSHPRYAREWLEHQAVAGLLDADDAGDPCARRYRLGPAAERVLADGSDVLYLAPLARQLAAAMRQLPDVCTAARTGGGVPWSAHGADMRESEGELNRPGYLRLLADTWLPAVPEVYRRLHADPPARVADVGCGAGWSTIALCRGFPRITVDAYEPDPPSAELARANIADAGLQDRAHVYQSGIESVTGEGRYDLITAFECLHDLPRPVEALTAMRRLTGAGGTVLIADMKVADTFTAPGDDLERLMYGFSLLICLPDSMSTEGSAATGTVLREPALREQAGRAGFRAVDIAPIDHDMWRFYLLRP